METYDFERMTPDDLKSYIAKHSEKDYLLIDVRQPDEYLREHIPGSILMPLTELEAKLYDLPSNQDLIFYCHTNGRSMAAAMLVVEGEVSEKQVYHLTGGIMGWDGFTLSDYPGTRIFDMDKSIAELLKTAINLEKGAWRFYKRAYELFGFEMISQTIQLLIDAELEHAGKIYFNLNLIEKQDEVFEDLFAKMDGEILEGGANLDDIVSQLDQESIRPCINFVGLALHIEYSAFDLYRTMAERVENKKMKEAFLELAQAEKAHMKLLSDSLVTCRV